jgi:hypothetical protein
MSRRDVDRWLSTLATDTQHSGPREGFGDRVMQAILEGEPWRLVRSVARAWLLPLLALAVLTSSWSVGSLDVVSAAVAAAADPLELGF